MEFDATAGQSSGSGRFTGRQQVAKPRGSAAAQNHFAVEAFRVDLTHELPAPAVRREDMQDALSVAPHGDNLRDAVLAGSHHGGDGRMLCAEPGARPGVDTDTRVRIAGIGDQCAPHIAEQPITHPVRIQHGLSGSEQIIVRQSGHLAEDTNVPVPKVTGFRRQPEGQALAALPPGHQGLGACTGLKNKLSACLPMPRWGGQATCHSRGLASAQSRPLGRDLPHRRFLPHPVGDVDALLHREVLERRNDPLSPHRACGLSGSLSHGLVPLCHRLPVRRLIPGIRHVFRLLTP
ncbi:hypothetical protein [Streptomyces cadmiisoli]|uniref:hypothetical protein n=1 Tax=Streptomyces cadmiisoli TaxID=2184053 RepID=UPI003666F9CB